MRLERDTFHKTTDIKDCLQVQGAFCFSRKKTRSGLFSFYLFLRRRINGFVVLIRSKPKAIWINFRKGQSHNLFQRIDRVKDSSNRFFLILFEKVRSMNLIWHTITIKSIQRESAPVNIYIGIDSARSTFLWFDSILHNYLQFSD